MSKSKGTRSFESFAGVSRCNVLLFGPFGSGKSSIVNSVTTGAGDVVERVAPIRDVLSNYSHVTRRYRRYRFGSVVSLFDPWGFANEFDWNLTQFHQVLTGRIPLETEEGEESYRQQQDGSLIIDVVVLCLPPEVFLELTEEDDSDSEEETIGVTLKKYVDACEEHGVPVVVAATKLDEFYLHHGPEHDVRTLRPHLARKALHQCHEWRDVFMNPLAQTLGKRVPMVPVINYTSTDEISHELISLLTGDLISKITEVALSHERERVPPPPRWFPLELFSDEGEPYVCEYRQMQPPVDAEEIPTSIQYYESLHQVPSAHFMLDLHFYQLRLADVNFRFFVVPFPLPQQDGSSFALQLIGLFDPISWTLFEAVHPDASLLTHLERSFGDRFVLSYEFLGRGRGRSTMQCLRNSEAVRLGLSGGSFPVVMRRIEATGIHAMIMNAISLIKVMERRQRGRERSE